MPHQRFHLAYGHLADLESRMPHALAMVSPAVRHRLEVARLEASDLRLTVELAEDQALLARSLDAMERGQPHDAEARLGQLERRILARAATYPCRADLDFVRQSLKQCADARRVDAEFELMQSAEERGDLVQYFLRGQALRDHLQTLPQTLPTKTAAGLVTAVRHWDPKASQLPAYAAMLRSSPHRSDSATQGGDGQHCGAGAFGGAGGQFLDSWEKTETCRCQQPRRATPIQA